MNFLLTFNMTNTDAYINSVIEKLLDGSLGIVKQLVIVLLIWLIGKKVVKILLNLLNKAFTKAKMDESLTKFLLSLFKFCLYAVLIVMIIGALGIETTSLITLIGSLGLTIGLSLQGSLSNFAGGVLILLFKPFKVGDYIAACGCEGTVSVIDLLYTKLYTVDNKMITIPNGTLANSNITNFASEPERRVDVSIDVAYSTDIDKAKATLEAVIKSTDNVLLNRDITLYIEKFSSSSITLTTRCWVKSENYWTVLWDLREKYKKALEENNISIPFPQIDVHMN